MLFSLYIRLITCWLVCESMTAKNKPNLLQPSASSQHFLNVNIKTTAKEREQILNEFAKFRYAVDFHTELLVRQLYNAI